jgi:glycosyltransferase involved in cell wall biosynthesis
MTAMAVPGVAALRSASGRLIAWQVRAVTGWFLMGVPHILITIPTAVDVLPHLPRRSLTYNRSDLHSSFPEVNGQLIAGMERGLLEAADAVVYVSHALMERDSADRESSQRQGREPRAHFLDHGVDLGLFGRIDGSEPPDMRNIPRPRVGFFGGLDDYVVDMRLIERLAADVPDASIVLIGDATCAMDTLTTRPNVFWLGRRDHAAIPAYGRGFDVAIMPWLDNEWIRNCNPIKLKEYLALDLPVVSTPYPELEPYSDIVHVAASEADFIQHVHALLQSPPSRTGVGPARVRGDDWVVKADTLLGIMESVACAE